MRWRDPRRSSNVEDRRGARVPMKAVGGGIGALIVLILMIFLNGGDSGINLPSNTAINQRTPLSPEEEQELANFVTLVLGDTEIAWSNIFAKEGLGDYPEPTLVLFTDAVESGCGVAESVVGPFYCPVDEKLYIDLSFYKDLKDRFGAPGDFAQAYVIAHEVGHHVQNRLGIMDEVQRAQEQSFDQAEANSLSIMLELQADCFAGVWGHNAEEARDVLEQGDVEEGLTAASAIGDDRLQMQAQGRVVPDTFTHGTSAQRVSWFSTGLEAGDIKSCDTFAVMDQ